MGRVRLGKTVHPLVSGEPMRKILIAATAVMLAAGASLFGASAAEKLKIGFIYLGPIGDLGWTYQHELARQAMVKEFGDKIETTYLENVSEGPDAERSIEQLARAGNKLIFTTSFGYMDPTLKVAKKYPSVHFEHATGYTRDANMSTYSACSAISVRSRSPRSSRASTPRCWVRRRSTPTSRSRSSGRTLGSIRVRKPT